MAGNNYYTRPSLGRQDASTGWLLLGENKGDFDPVWPAGSGISLQGDARKMYLFELEGKPHLVVVVNNGDLRVLRHGK